MIPSSKTARQLYQDDEVAAAYDAKRADAVKWQREHDALATMLQGVTGTLLDIPVGTGRFLKLYQSHGLRVTGMDVSNAMLAQAASYNTGAHLITGDVFSIAASDRAFDTVVCVRLLNIINESEMVRAVKELCRVAKNRLIVSIRTGNEIGRKRLSWTHRYSVFVEAVKAGGFESVESIICEGDNYRMVRMER